MTTALAYSYPRLSSVDAGAMGLATSGLDVAPELYFRGFLERPDVAAAALLCVARVARTRFFLTSATLQALIDPVFTSEPAGLHVESFSGCCGVHARLHLLTSGLDTECQASGTVNVDFNEPMRAALARVHGRNPLRLQVGFDAVEVQTMDGSPVERRVALPERWAKGFAEVQMATSQLPKAFELDARGAQRFMRSLPGGKAGQASLWARPAASGARLSARAGDGAVWLAAPERLRMLAPLVRHLRGLRAFAVPDARGSSLWVADLGDAHLMLTLSPERTRGFSGEGGLLFDLADDTLRSAAEMLDRALAGRWRFSLDDTTGRGLTPERARRALTWLGARGKLGFDPITREWFRRALPFPPAAFSDDPPRLRGARKLMQAGGVRPLEGARFRVTSADRRYDVCLDPPGCTCAWWLSHPGDRGPCKHILAATLSAARAPTCAA